MSTLHDRLLLLESKIDSMRGLYNLPPSFPSTPPPGDRRTFKQTATNVQVSFTDKSKITKSVEITTTQYQESFNARIRSDAIQDELIRRLQAELAEARRAAQVHEDKAKLLIEGTRLLEERIKTLTDQNAQLETVNQHLAQLGQTWEEKAKRSEERNSSLRAELEKSKNSFAQKIVWQKHITQDMSSKHDALRAENVDLKKEIEELRKIVGGEKRSSSVPIESIDLSSSSAMASQPPSPSKPPNLFSKMRRGSSPTVYASDGETTPKAKTSLAKKFGLYWRGKSGDKRTEDVHLEPKRMDNLSDFSLDAGKDDTPNPKYTASDTELTDTEEQKDYSSKQQNKRPSTPKKVPVAANDRSKPPLVPLNDDKPKKASTQPRLSTDSSSSQDPGRVPSPRKEKSNVQIESIKKTGVRRGSAPVKPIQSPQSQTPEFGSSVQRGACSRCSCSRYIKKADGYGCRTCNHFPAQHSARLDTDEERAAPEHIESTTPRSANDLAELTKQHLRENLDAAWQLDYNDFYFLDQLGKGNSSMVYVGTYKEQKVALKVLRLENHQRDLEDFKKELEIMSLVKHPTIVNFYGASLEPKLVIALEYCSKGSLFHYLQDVSNPISWTHILQWLNGIATGIDVLHQFSPSIVHRDLKTLNLLLDANLGLKVCDFGLSRLVEANQPQQTLFKMRGTYAYIAPEVYHGNPFTTKSDIYSIGIIMWEMLHRLLVGRHTRPYAEFPSLQHDFQIIIQAATKNTRPTLPPSTPAPVAELVHLCWAADPTKRPTAAELLTRIDTLSREYKEKQELWDRAVFVRPT